MAEHAPARRFWHRLTLTEVSGAMGDLGTYIPIVVALCLQYGLSLRGTLVLSGIASVSTGLLFDIPMAVQPMKSIAAVALAADVSEGFSIDSMLAAGIITASFVMLLGMTGLIDHFNQLIPLPVVRGLQLGLGALLAKKGVGLLATDHDWTARLFGWNGHLLAVLCFSFVVLFYRSNRVPSALLLFSFGLTIASLRSIDSATDSSMNANTTGGCVSEVPVAEEAFVPHIIGWDDWQRGFIYMAVPQIPLTTLNSAIAVCKLSGDLFPDRPAEPARVATSVGAMNICMCVLGGFPMCHGAGGLAGQYRFGGRSGVSVILLGGLKVTLGMLFGQSCLELLHACTFPYSVLGTMLCVSGLELAIAGMVAKESDSTGDAAEREWETNFLLVSTAVGTIAYASTALGFAIGLLVHGILRASVLLGVNDGESQDVRTCSVETEGSLLQHGSE